MNKSVLVGIALVVAVGVAIGSALTARIAAERADTLAAEIERHKQAIATLEKTVATQESTIGDARTKSSRALALAEAHQTKAEAAERAKDPFAASRKAEQDRAYEQLKRDVETLKSQMKK